MDAVIRLEIGVLLRGAIAFLTYVVITATVWNRADFGGLLAAVPLMMLSGLVDRQAATGGPHYQPFGQWLRTVVVHSAGLAATLAVGIVGLGAMFDRQTLRSTDQRAAAALLSAVAVVALVYVLLPARDRAEPATSVDREARKAEVRARIRREIEQMEVATVAQVITPEPTAPPEDEGAVETLSETWETRDWAAFLAKVSKPDVAA